MINALEEHKADLLACRVVKSQMCSFWKKGKCKRGAACTFAHGTSEMTDSAVLQVVPCVFHRAGFCRLGEKCRNVHEEVASVESRQSSAALHRKAALCHFQKLGYCRFGDRCLQAHSEQELIRPGCADGLESSRTRAYAKHADRQSNIGLPRGITDQENPPRMITKKLICSFWQKGRCTRGSDCSFAHGSEELNQTAADQFYKTSICRYFKTGRCQLGSECRQAHCKEDLAHFKGTDFDKSDEYKEFMNPSEL